MDNSEITPKEIAIGAGIVLILIAIAILLNPAVKAPILARIHKLETALKVTDPVTLEYSRVTEVGNVLAYGNLEASDPVQIPDLTNKYSIIRKEHEHYTRHTRSVCASTDKKGNCTSYREEVYYTWDNVGDEEWMSTTYVFLGQSFSASSIALPSGNRLDLTADTVSSHLLSYVGGNYVYESEGWLGPGGDDRWYYRVVPTSYAITMFLVCKDKVIRSEDGNRIPTYVGTTPEQLIQGEKDYYESVDIWYYLIVGFFGLFIAVWFASSFDIQ